MKSPLFFIALFIASFCPSVFGQVTSLTLVDSAIFYDGYAPMVNFPTSQNTIRLRNDLMTTKLTIEQQKQLQHATQMRVTISARCDNYDRIGNVFVALVPKGQTVYQSDSVTKIELGRFITPFMNKNKDPKSVSYVFDCSMYASLFSNKELSKTYDFWIECGVFGVPYAAQKQVAGCSERNDVFQLALSFELDKKKAPSYDYFPIVAYRMINNYESNATDTLGKTTKSYLVTLPRTLKDVTMLVTSSNHGANEGGEEYIRRKHFLYLDGNQCFTYTPGGKSCEPFRINNTQGNGIYGKTVETDSSWASWNNWCPGNAIPTRSVELGTLQKGTHTILFTVPDAQFVDKTGYFPLSIILYAPKKKKWGFH
jgi:hypothetical protein